MAVQYLHETNSHIDKLLQVVDPKFLQINTVCRHLFRGVQYVSLSTQIEMFVYS